MMNPLRLLQLLKLLDVTRLQDNDEQPQMTDWLAQLPITPAPVAALCVYPEFLGVARYYITQSKAPIALATVVNFPGGDQSLATVLADIATARQASATEIDCVLPYQTLLSGKETEVAQFLAAVRAASQGLCLKIIIESGELLTAQQITKASELVIDCGAEFIKTSTGKVPVGVTLEAAKIILTSIAAADRPVGFKASGGVKTVEQALEIVSLYEQVTGKTAQSEGLRIGASTLLTELCQQLAS